MLDLAHRRRQRLVGEAVLAPLVGVRRGQLLAAPVQAEQRQGHGPESPWQWRAGWRSPYACQPGAEAGDQQDGEPGMGQSAAGGVFHELRVDQVGQVVDRGQPADGADQLGGCHPQAAPGQ
ncbi:hypothetical protein WR25_00540 [Diploscapter pachys]|uniref:Uncharacterized protein n=1 Tax=Diploscapter pachys TaxID=2018661 RepID=A0A2A2K3R0_9BILA|nr:hypothetical protein WR25_00540 [Diploscapter pachys]